MLFFRNSTSLPDSISIKVGHNLKHEVINDNRPKRRDRTNGFIQPESRSRHGLAESEAQEKEINLTSNENSQNQEDYLPNFQRKASAEFFRAGQSDSDPLSLGELKPIEISEAADPQEYVLQPRELAQPRSADSGKKTIFDELKNLEGSVFGEEVNKIFFSTISELDVVLVGHSDKHCNLSHRKIEQVLSSSDSYTLELSLLALKATISSDSCL